MKWDIYGLRAYHYMWISYISSLYHVNKQAAHEAANCYIQIEMASKASSSPCSEIFMFYSVQQNAIFTVYTTSSDFVVCFLL